MPRTDLREALLRDLVLREPLFTSGDAAALTGAAPVSLAKALERLARQGAVVKVRRGLWANPRHPLFSPYLVVGRLQEGWGQPAYVSGISALHLHGMLSQIPREMHVATARRRPTLRTPIGAYVFHQLEPALLAGDEAGDEWGRFQRATPEKALFDTVYLSLHRRARWRHLPEIDLPAKWSWDAWTPWIAAISFPPFRIAMETARQDLRARLGGDR